MSRSAVFDFVGKWYSALMTLLMTVCTLPQRRSPPGIEDSNQASLSTDILHHVDILSAPFEDLVTSEIVTKHWHHATDDLSDRK